MTYFSPKTSQKNKNKLNNIKASKAAKKTKINVKTIFVPLKNQ